MVTNPISVLINYVKGLHRTVKIWLINLGSYQTGSQLTQRPNYNTLYAYELGATPTQIGFLNSLNNIFRTLVLIPAGWLGDRYGATITVLIGAVLAILVPTIYFLATSWWMAMPAVILAGMMMSIVMPYGDIILIHHMKPEVRAMGIGFSRTLWAIPQLFIPTIVAIIVASSGGISVEGIRPIFLIQICLFAIVLLITITELRRGKISKKDDRQGDRQVKRTTSSSFLQDYLEVFRGGGGILRFLIVWIARQFTMRLVTPFIYLFAVEFKGADSFILGGWATASALLTLIASLPIGRLSDKYGRKKVVYLTQPLSWLRFLLLIVAPSPIYLIGVGIFEGANQAAGLTWITMMWEMVPEEKRGRWYAMWNTFALINSVAPMLGSFLWEQGATTLLFIIPILIDFIILLPILRTIPEIRRV